MTIHCSSRVHPAHCQISDLLIFTKCLQILLFGYQAAIAIKISNLLICFCSFDLSCSILEKHILIEHLYIVLSCLMC